MTGRPLAPLKLSAGEDEALRGLASRRRTAQALALRARIVLACAAGAANKAVAAKLGVTPQTVGKWRARFLAQRLDGLYDEPRPGVPRSIDDAKVEAVIVATLETMPQDATHWSSRAMARQSGISTSSVQRIWRAFGLQPHRVETFKLSTDLLFVANVRDIVGLYMSPPDHPLVLCVDEKSQVQALDRTQPLLPLSPGAGRAAQPRLQAPWHDGAVRRPRCRHRPRARPLVQTASRHRVRALPRCHRSGRAGRSRHPYRLDNYATHKAPAIKAWFAKRPRYHLHFTPTYASWLNQVERWFALLTERQIRRGVHRSVKELDDAISAFIVDHNAAPQPFRWTKSADAILQSVARFCQRTLAIHVTS